MAAASASHAPLINHFRPFGHSRMEFPMRKKSERGLLPISPNFTVGREVIP